MKEQVFTDFEVLILCNGCTDNSINAAAHHIGTDERFKITQIKFANKSSALNIGLILSSRDWIAIYDVDDRWHIEKLNFQSKEIRESEIKIDILGTQMFYLSENNEIQGEGPHLPTMHKDITAMLLERNTNPFCNSSVVYRKALHFTNVGFYDPQCAVEDYDFWVRCALVDASLKNLGSLLSFHRLHSGSNFNGTDRQKNDKRFIDSKMEYRKQNKQGS